MASRAPRPHPRWLAAAVLACGVAAATAQEVSLAGLSDGRALLQIDGGPPRLFSPGQSRDGVRLVSVGADGAVVELGGQRQTLRLGQAPLNLDAASRSGAERIVLQADGGGHFTTLGQINGKTVTFVVDTGATVVVLSQSDAQRIGLSMQAGQPVRMATANGVVTGREVRLATVRVGTAQVHDVPGVVLPQPLPYVLLGNSFLSRFQMQRTNDQMVLEKRY